MIKVGTVTSAIATVVVTVSNSAAQEVGSSTTSGATAMPASSLIRLSPANPSPANDTHAAGAPKSARASTDEPRLTATAETQPPAEVPTNPRGSPAASGSSRAAVTTVIASRTQPSIE